MRVNGEAYLLINGWMNYLSLLLAARALRARFFPWRGAAAALAGAGYAVAAWNGGPLLRGNLAVITAALGMALIAFGRRAPGMWGAVLASGLLLSGVSSFLNVHGAGTVGNLAMCGGVALVLCRATGKRRIAENSVWDLTVVFRGKKARLPAFRDSGNLLTDMVTGLPVIVAPEGAMRSLLPPGTQANRVDTLPPGLWLIRAETAAGEQMLMCLHPDAVYISQGIKKRRADAVVAVAGYARRTALLPEGLFQREEGKAHAGF